MTDRCWIWSRIWSRSAGDRALGARIVERRGDARSGVGPEPLQRGPLFGYGLGERARYVAGFGEPGPACGVEAGAQLGRVLLGPRHLQHGDRRADQRAAAVLPPPAAAARTGRRWSPGRSRDRLERQGTRVGGATGVAQLVEAGLDRRELGPAAARDPGPAARVRRVRRRAFVADAASNALPGTRPTSSPAVRSRSFCSAVTASATGRASAARSANEDSCVPSAASAAICTPAIAVNAVAGIATTIASLLRTRHQARPRRRRRRPSLRSPRGAKAGRSPRAPTPKTPTTADPPVRGGDRSP